MTNALRSTDPEFHDDLMTSLIYSANARVKDPVHGCLGEIQSLHSKIMYAQKELDFLRSQIQQFHNQNNQNQRFDSQHFEKPQSIPSFQEPQLMNIQHRGSNDVSLYVDDYVVNDQQFQNQHFEGQQYIPSFHQPEYENNQYSAIDNDSLPYNYYTETDLFGCTNQESTPSWFPQPQHDGDTQRRVDNDDVPLSVDDYVVNDQQFQNQHFEGQQYIPSFHQPEYENNNYSAIDNDSLPYNYYTETDLFGCTNQESTPSWFPQPQHDGDTQQRVDNDDVPLSVDDYVVDEAFFVECPDQQFQNQPFENQQYMPSFHQPEYENNQYSAIDNDSLPYNYVTKTDLFGCTNQESTPSWFPQPQHDGDTQHRVNNDDVPLSVDDYVVDEAFFIECPDQQFQNQPFENQQYMPSFHQPQYENNNQYRCSQ
ncbi:unnamed protein product [Amaranthus hypochondriacus]